MNPTPFQTPLRPYRFRFQEAIADFRRNWIASFIQWGLWWLTFSIFFLALWIRQKFGIPTFNQFMFHLRLGYHGLLTAGYYPIKSFVVSCVLLPGIAAWILSVNRQLKKLFFAAPVVCLFLACIFLLDHVSFFAYAENQTGFDYFAAHYKDPKQVALSEKNPRNLVLIYVESLEATYSNERLFGRDLLHHLNASALHGLSFNQYDQVPGANWTIAGIVSTQCGVPLETLTLYDRNVQGEKLASFLPGAVCLGDVLNAYGYRNIFMEGAGLNFSGKGQFLKDHHYAERYGREEWIAQGEKSENMSAWGLHDDDLFRHAKAELDKQEALGERFNLTLLTLDTHYSGIESTSRYCAEHGARNFEDLVECTADQVADFVDYIRQKGYLKNIDVVILGDHLAMTNPASSRLAEVPERHVFNLFVSQDLPRKTREDIVHFDLFPTILDFMGLHVRQGQLALGYSGFSSSSLLPPATRVADMRRDLLHPSPLYNNLWDPEAVNRS